MLNSSQYPFVVVPSNSNSSIENATAVNQDEQTVAIEQVRDRLPIPWSIFNHTVNPTTNIKAATSLLHSFYASNLSDTTTYFLQFFNKNSEAIAGDTPIITAFELQAGDTLAIGSELFGSRGVSFDSGLTYGISTTRNSYTAGSAADIQLTVWYE